MRSFVHGLSLLRHGTCLMTGLHDGLGVLPKQISDWAFLNVRGFCVSFRKRPFSFLAHLRDEPQETYTILLIGKDKKNSKHSKLDSHNGLELTPSYR